MVPSQKPTGNVRRQQADQRVRGHERVGCSRPHARSFSNNRSRVHLHAEVALQAVPGGSVCPAESSMALLHGAAELLLRRTDQHEHWVCCSLLPYFHSPAHQGATTEVPSSTTRKPVRYIARQRTRHQPSLVFRRRSLQSVVPCIARRNRA